MNRRQDFERGIIDETWLLGDSGYPLEPWLMTPVPNAQTDAERLFNERHMKARQIVERCIGLLKNRFRCISRERILKYDPKTAGLIINSCIILHNMMIEFNNGEYAIFPNEDDNANERRGEDVENAIDMNQGIAIRNNIIENYFTNI